MVVARDADRVLAEAVAAGVAPGVVAMAADDAGVLYAGAAGARVAGGPADMGLDTVVGIASMTKAVTSVAATQLVEEGRIGLDEPLGDRIPELAEVRVLAGFDAAGEPRLRPPRRPVTLRHLLTHTSGFAYHTWNADLLRFHDRTGMPTISTLRKACLRAPLVCDPGERWEYGIGADWVGQVVERVGGRPLDAYVRERILDPLGMGDTGYVLRPDQRSRLAHRHARQPDGSLRPIPPEAPPEPEFWSGGGGLSSTGPDYLRFLRMLLGGGHLDRVRVLRPETVAEMGRNQIGALTAGRLVSVVPEASNSVEFFPGTVKRWGLATMITAGETGTGRAAGSWCWGGLANTYFWVDPARRVTGLLLTQILPFADPGVLDLLARFERAVYGAAAPARRSA